MRANQKLLIISFFSLVILTGFSEFNNNKKCIIVPGKGLNSIEVGKSTLKDVKTEFGKTKVQKIWHETVEFEFVGKFEYFLKYVKHGTFSTLTKNRNRKMVMKIIIDSSCNCKTKNGLGVGSSYKETILKLGKPYHDGYDSVGERKWIIYLYYDNMDISFDGDDKKTSKISKIVIHEW